MCHARLQSWQEKSISWRQWKFMFRCEGNSEICSLNVISRHFLECPRTAFHEDYLKLSSVCLVSGGQSDSWLQSEDGSLQSHVLYCVYFQSVMLVTMEVVHLVPCVPETLWDQHQVVLQTAQLIHHVMEQLMYQVQIILLVISDISHLVAEFMIGSCSLQKVYKNNLKGHESIKYWAVRRI